MVLLQLSSMGFLESALLQLNNVGVFAVTGPFAAGTSQYDSNFSPGHPWGLRYQTLLPMGRTGSSRRRLLICSARCRWMSFSLSDTCRSTSRCLSKKVTASSIFAGKGSGMVRDHSIPGRHVAAALPVAVLRATGCCARLATPDFSFGAGLLPLRLAR